MLFGEQRHQPASQPIGLVNADLPIEIQINKADIGADRPALTYRDPLRGVFAEWIVGAASLAPIRALNVAEGIESQRGFRRRMR